MTGRNVFERALALLLALVLVVGLVPVTGIPAASAATVTGKVADESTMNTWKTYFPAHSTAHAGAVWTDKSVFTDASAFSGVNKLPGGGAANVTVDPDNFLVALSAIASTSQIEGYSTTPTDTMLVLDVSGSMAEEYTVGYSRWQYGYRVGYEEVSAVQTATVQAMVEAANEAIYKLLSLNKHNRVGVVLYSGNTEAGASDTSTGNLLLPLGRYNGIVNGTEVEYLSTDMTQQTQTLYRRLNQNSYESMGNVTYATAVAVSIKDGLRTENNGAVADTSKTVVGGTYIQNGLSIAWDQFKGRIDAGDTVIEDEKLQAGTKRIPIMVLMSDGSPTTATEDYNDIGTSDAGSGTSDHATASVGFLTQLTASWIRGNMESGYATTPKFYTLGLGSAGTQATGIGVLNPTNFANNASDYWTELLNPADGSVNLTLPNTSGSNTHTATITKLDSTTLVKNYVDQYWYAEDADDMVEAFTEIVDEIILQSKYYATLVSGGQHDIEGYITVTDEIGEHMEVKKVTGLVLGDELFSGEEMASAMTSGVLGDPSDPSSLGNEFIWTVQERLGIESVTEARALIDAAYNTYQLYPGDASNPASNYIGWYESANGEYLGHWNESHTAEDKPTGALYINKSYGYLGDHMSSDLMHVVVKVSTNIDNGHQMVQYQIPASLIPMVTYKITIEGDVLSNAGNPVLESDTESVSPLQLLFEVGLKDTINEVTIADIMAAADHSHPNADGSYSFYSNRWGITDMQDPTNPSSHKVATAHFHPSLENEYYRFREAETVRDASANAVTALVTDGSVQYYYTRQVVETSGGNTTVTDVLVKLSAKDLQHAVQQADGTWQIPAGTVNVPSNDVRMTKRDTDPAAAGIQHPTSTLDYYSYPYGEHDHGTDDYNMYAYLGNNGTFKITPATGIRLKKTVAEAVDGASDVFTFTVTLSEAAPNASVTDADGIAKTSGWSVSGNVITVELKDGETVNIIGLPADATYSIEEEPGDYYDVTIAPQTGIITDKQLIAVNATNSPKTYGDLIIEKDVIHPFGGNLTDQIFTFTAVIEDITEFQANNITVPAGATKSFANGDLTISGITVADDASVTIGHIPHGVHYTVTEATKPGYAMDAAASNNTDGFIAGNSSVTAQFINNYNPVSITPVITVGGTKTFTTNASANCEFEFLLEKYDPATGTYTGVSSAQMTMNATGTQDYTITMNEPYTTVGVHYYRIYEKTGSQSNLIYDGTQGLFTVTVTDDNHDGVLEVAVTSSDDDVTVSGSGNTYHVDKDFANSYNADETYVDINIEKLLNNTTGVEIPRNIFHFQMVNDADPNEVYNVTTNAEGKAVIRVNVNAVGEKVYTLKELDGSLVSMTYDTTPRTVKISTVEESGKLVASVSVDGGAATVGTATEQFTNTYELDPVDVNINVYKTMRDMVSGGIRGFTESAFKIQIESTDDSYVPDGKVSVKLSPDSGGHPRTYTQTITQVGTYRYKVKELENTLPGVTNDTSEFHVTVVVTADDVTGKLVATQTITKVGEGTVSEIRFINVYDVTGEAELPISGTKFLENRDMVAGKFHILLKDSANGDVLQRVGVHADGKYAFQPLKYTPDDIGKTFTYTVSEEIPADAVRNSEGKLVKNGVIYDETVRTVTVKVEDNGEGGIRLRNANDQVITEVSGLTFTNSYATRMEQPVAISGEKFITGDRTAWLDGETYTFELVDSLGNVLATDTVSKNDKNFTLVLPTYYYADQDNNDLGVHHYIVREMNEGRPGIGYDGTVYNVEVSVSDFNGRITALVTVTKPGVGNIPQDALNFGNVYTIDDEKTLTLSGTKTMAGDRNVLTAGDIYTFVLKDAAGTVLQQKSNNTAGAYSFEELKFTKADIARSPIKYTVEEGDTTVPGVTKSNVVYAVEVNISDNGDGKLKLDYTISNGANSVAADKLDFVNTYTIDDEKELNLSGKKTLNGNKPMAAGDYKFELVDAATGTVLQTKDNAIGGEYAFEALKFDESHVGQTFTYTVREKDTGLDDVHYDITQYTVTVTISDNGDGKIKLDYTITDNTPNNQLNFTNSYSVVDDDELVLSGIKTITGDRNALTADDIYSFELVDAATGTVLQTKQNDASGAYRFDKLTFNESHVDQTFEYIVREKDSAVAGVTKDSRQYTVTVRVKDQLDGTITLLVNYSNGATATTLNFQNTYTINDSKTLPLSGKKTVTGDRTALTSADVYTFLLKAENGTLLQTRQNMPNGTFAFTPLTFTKADIARSPIKYTVEEADTTVGGITKSNVVYTVEVTVSDKGDGTLNFAYTITDGTNSVENSKLDFVNTYTINDSKTLPLSGTKSVTGDRTALTSADVYTFLLKAENGTLLQTRQNMPNGTFAFAPLTFTKADIARSPIKYTVEEADTTVAGITKSNVVYTVEVTVADKGDGTLDLRYTITDGTNSVENSKLDFVNTYTIDDEKVLELSGKKTLTGNKPMAAGDYKFELVDAATGTVLQTKDNAIGGEYAFEALKFDESHVGQTFTYTVREKNTGLDDVYYDPNIYTVTVTVSDNGDGKIKLDYSITNNTPNNQLNFTNAYSVVDDDELVLSGKKTITGDRTALTAQDIYSFELVDKATGTVLQEEQNDASGAYSFEKLAFDQRHVGQTFEYIVREKDSAVAGVTKDSREYTVTVKVKDMLDGNIALEVGFTGGATATTLNFQNTYTIDDAKTLILAGNKTITGDRTGLIGGDVYTFLLKAEDGTVLQSRQNLSTGAYAFEALRFTKADIARSPIKYTVVEADSTVPGVAKSNVVYTVEVTVSDNGDGKIKLDYTITDGTNNIAADELDFVNTYAITGNQTLTLSGKKVLENKALSAGDFAFELYNADTDTVEQTVKNAADGSYGFAALTFDRKDIGQHNYIIREKNTGVAGVTYSNVKYAVWVKIFDKGDGTLGMDYTVTKERTNDTAADALDFVNTYAATPAKVTISGVKKMDGDRTELAQQDVYTFELVDKASGKVLDTATNDAQGKFTFETITYTYTNETVNDLGEHNYIIREVKGNLGGVTYDATEYAVKVTVTDLGGQLNAAVEISNNGKAVGQEDVVYTNIYVVTSTNLVLEGTKQMVGKALADDAYSFSVLENGKEVTTGTNKGSNIVFQPITYAKPGTYNYTVVEKIPADAQKVENTYVKDGVIYDSTVYTVTVTVTDNGDGTLHATAVYSKPIAFVNTYVAEDVPVVLLINKSVENKTEDTIGPEGFQFTLTDENGQVLQTVLSDGNGKAQFHLNYSEAEIGKHTYTVSETNTHKTGVTYDKTTYKVVVTVTKDAVSGDLSAACSVDGKDVQAVALAFNNSYEKPVTPSTGDDFNIVLVSSVMLLSVVALAVLVLGKKKVFDNK